MDLTLGQWLDYLSKLGGYGFSLALLYFLFKGWVMTKDTHDLIVKQHEERYADLTSRCEKLESQNQRIIGAALQGTALAQSFASLVTSGSGGGKKD